MPPNSALAGGCQCGAVRYRIADVSEPASICHCRMCQKAHGAPVVGWVSIAGSHFAWTRGAPSRFHSSTVATRTFCSLCGTPLTFSLDAEASIDVATATLDEPERLPPASQYGVDSRMSWFVTAHTLPGKAAGPIAHSNQHPDHETEHWPPQETM